MSTHNIPANVELDRLQKLLRDNLRTPEGVIHGNGLGTRPTALEFTPDLTGPQSNTLTLIFGVASRSQELTPAQEQAIRDERAVLAAFLSNATPLLTDVVAALKATIRVLRVIAKE